MEQWGWDSGARHPSVHSDSLKLWRCGYSKSSGDLEDHTESLPVVRDCRPMTTKGDSNYARQREEFDGRNREWRENWGFWWQSRFSLISSALRWAWGRGSGEQWWAVAERRLGRCNFLLAVRSPIHFVCHTPEFSMIFGLVHSKFAFFFFPKWIN